MLCKAEVPFVSGKEFSILVKSTLDKGGNMGETKLLLTAINGCQNPTELGRVQFCKKFLTLCKEELGEEECLKAEGRFSQCYLWENKPYDGAYYPTGHFVSVCMDLINLLAKEGKIRNDTYRRVL